MKNWPQCLLPEVVTFQEGPGILAKDFHETGIPLVRLSGLGGYEVTLDGCNYVSEEKSTTKWKHFRLNQGDILISTSASFGRPAIVGEEVTGALFYTGIIRFRSSSPRLDEGYLKLFLGSRAFSLQASAVASGSVIQHYGPSHLKRMTIDLPPIAMQRHIAAVISALDDKIELNRRMNDTLEASARALFRDWFVDFGPTRAKSEGRPAYLAPDLWSLFPVQVDGEGVPEGWSETPLDQIAEFLNGLALQKFPAAPDEESLPVIKIGELRSGVSASSNRASIDVPAKYIIGDGDFLFSWSGSLLAKFWTEGAGALNQHLFKVTSDSFPPWFFSQWVWQNLAEFQAIAASKATTMGHIQRGHLSAATTITPPPAMLAKMSEVMQPLLDQIIGNLLECRTLVATRDALLPKLMSGALRVRDAAALAA